MYEIDGTAYINRSHYKRCLEKMRTSSKRTIRLLKKMHAQAKTEEEKQLIEEAHAAELSHLAYAHFNIAWLKKPDIMKHYPATEGEREGANNDTTRS